MTANLNIIKRDGSKVEFDKSKIKNAILKAMKYGSGIMEQEIASDIADEIEKGRNKASYLDIILSDIKYEQAYCID